LSVPGLEGPVDIQIDRWGIPHIRASTAADLFFAQGFNARDRLWQIDLAGALGLRSRFRPGLPGRDRRRLFLYRGDMDRVGGLWQRRKAIAEAFTRGINA
jgi:penicillin amidase